MTTCLGIRSATHWADARSIERISCVLISLIILSCWFGADMDVSYMVIVSEDLC